MLDEFNPVAALVSGVFSLLVIILLWKSPLNETGPMWVKIVLSIACIPLFYLIVNMQIGD
jgi:hypothetical protein